MLLLLESVVVLTKLETDPDTRDTSSKRRDHCGIVSLLLNGALFQTEAMNDVAGRADAPGYHVTL
jgi:hypothetical protein